MMIRYALRCADNHEFEGWFRSSSGFEGMRDRGQIACTFCGSHAVDRAPMAPAIPSERAHAGDRAAERASSDRATEDRAADDRTTDDRASPAPDPACETVTQRVQRSLAELQAHVEANSDYVGMRFVQEARAMHEGRRPERAIHGECRVEDARKLIEDGVKVAPLPFRSKRRMN